MSLRHDVAPTDVPTLDAMSREGIDAADRVIAFHRPSAGTTPEVVVELRDMHRNLLARTVVLTEDELTAVTDQLLAGAQLDRCSDFITDPLGRTKVRRSIASVCPGVNASTSVYERARSNAPSLAI